MPSNMHADAEPSCVVGACCEYVGKHRVDLTTLTVALTQSKKLLPTTVKPDVAATLKKLAGARGSGNTSLSQLVRFAPTLSSLKTLRESISNATEGPTATGMQPQAWVKASCGVTVTDVIVAVTFVCPQCSTTLFEEGQGYHSLSLTRLLHYTQHVDTTDVNAPQQAQRA